MGMCLHTVCVEQPDQHHLKAHNAHGITHDCYMEVVWTRCPFVDVAGFWKLKRFCFSAQAPRAPRIRPKTAASGPSQYSPKCPRKALVFKVGAGNRLATSPGPNVHFAIANLPKTSHVKSTGLVTRGLQPAAPKGHKPARDGQFVAQIPGPRDPPSISHSLGSKGLFRPAKLDFASTGPRLEGGLFVLPAPASEIRFRQIAPVAL